MVLFMIKIDSVLEFKDLLIKDFVLLKHSNTCPVSFRAFSELENFKTNFSVYYLVVQESRELSNFISDFFGVKHESPQVLFFKKGVVVWHDSHFLINESNLSQKIQ